MHTVLRVAALSAALSLGGAAEAALVSIAVTGGAPGIAGQILTPPEIDRPVGNNQRQASRLYGFDDRGNVTLGADQPVDLGAAIRAGVAVNSHYLFFDPRRARQVEATVTFSTPILGIITRRGQILATNALLGLPGVTYLGAPLTGLEAVDRIAFAGNTLTLAWRASNPGDHVRVLTAVPLPAAAPLLAAALAGLAALRRLARTAPTRHAV